MILEDAHWIEAITSKYPIDDDTAMVYYLGVKRHNQAVSMSVYSLLLSEASTFKSYNPDTVYDAILCSVMLHAHTDVRTFSGDMPKLDVFLVTSLNSACSYVGSNSRRATANSVLASPKLSTLYSQIPLYNGIKIYACDQLPDNEIIAAYRADANVLDSAIKLVRQPSDGLMHACFHPGWENYYCKMTLDGLPELA